MTKFILDKSEEFAYLRTNVVFKIIDKHRKAVFNNLFDKILYHKPNFASA